MGRDYTPSAVHPQIGIGVRRWRVSSDEHDQVPDLATVRPVAKGRLLPGVVVWAHVPFAEVETEKTRPAVIKSVSGRNVTILPASSATSRHRFPARYAELRDPRDAGLSRPTGIRRREVTVDLIEIISIIGILSDADMASVFHSHPCQAASLEGGGAA